MSAYSGYCDEPDSYDHAACMEQDKNAKRAERKQAIRDAAKPAAIRALVALAERVKREGTYDSAEALRLAREAGLVAPEPEAEA